MRAPHASANRRHRKSLARLLAWILACLVSRAPRGSCSFAQSVSQSVSYFTVPPRARSAETEPFKTPGGPPGRLGQTVNLGA